MESAVIVYLAIHRLVNWTTWKTTGFQARPKTKTKAGPTADGIVVHPQRHHHPTTNQPTYSSNPQSN
ncbi:hypothetical protein [Companilactobacillus sp. HBUAS59699]|uniref:hypothetical protein n=1 Tax=Companilactobacillus sp. HBUAS59699 TaxID=3109358 RepID=UPI002FEF03EB